MFYRIAADIAALSHLLWIFFLIFGVFIGRKYRTVKILHITGLGFAVIIQIFEFYCPLTYLEIWLRLTHNPSQGYTGSFITNYVEKLVYIEVSAVTIQIATIILVLISGLIYLYKPKKAGKP